MTKPLGHKAYGHIPHLPNSRMGPGDHHCHEGQARMVTEKRRDKYDEIIVTEKLDGSNVAVVNLDGIAVPLMRAGYHASTSKHEQHRMFVDWVRDNEPRFIDMLLPGERVCGEWLAMAHGTLYNLPHEPFVVFDMMLGRERSAYDRTVGACELHGFTHARLLHRGDVYSVERMLQDLEPSGHGALEPVEGAVWRVERKGVFDFICKWVRPDKVDGKYFGNGPIWNTWPIAS